MRDNNDGIAQALMNVKGLSNSYVIGIRPFPRAPR